MRSFDVGCFDREFIEAFLVYTRAPAVVHLRVVRSVMVMSSPFARRTDVSGIYYYLDKSLESDLCAHIHSLIYFRTITTRHNDYMYNIMNNATRGVCVY